MHTLLLEYKFMHFRGVWWIEECAPKFLLKPQTVTLFGNSVCACD